MIVGIAFFVVQIIGCIVGAFLAWLFVRNAGIIMINDNNDYLQACVAETLGSLLFVFIFLTQTDPFTRFSNDLGIWSLVIAASYSSVISYASARIIRSMNPAYAIAVQLTYWIDNQPGFTFKYIWIYILCPIVASLIALVFYDFVYKKAIEECSEDVKNNTKIEVGE